MVGVDTRKKGGGARKRITKSHLISLPSKNDAYQGGNTLTLTERGGRQLGTTRDITPVGGVARTGKDGAGIHNLEGGGGGGGKLKIKQNQAADLRILFTRKIHFVVLNAVGG